MKGEACIRRKVVIDDEKLRRIVDAICHFVTEAQGGGEEDEHIQA